MGTFILVLKGTFLAIFLEFPVVGLTLARVAAATPRVWRCQLQGQLSVIVTGGGSHGVAVRQGSHIRAVREGSHIVAVLQGSHSEAVIQ